MNRLCVIMATAGLSTLGAAQTTPPSATAIAAMEALITQAYTTLAQQSLVELDLAGTVTTSTTTRKFSSTLFLETGTDPVTFKPTLAKLELDDYDVTGPTPVLTHRYVGDGQVLWIYDPVNYRYSTRFYRYFAGQTPVDFSGTDATRLLAQLYSQIQGPSTYLVRLMREVNPYADTNNPLTPTYETWAPGYTPGIPPALPATPDPLVPTRTYSSDGPEVFVVYGPYTTRPTRSVAFDMYDTNNSQGIPVYQLQNVYYANLNPEGLINLSIHVSTPASLPTGTFVPYSTASIAGWYLGPA